MVKYKLNAEGRKELGRAGKEQQELFHEFIVPRLGSGHQSAWNDLKSRGLSCDNFLELIRAINESNIPNKVKGGTIQIDLQKHVEEVSSGKRSDKQSEVRHFHLKNKSADNTRTPGEYAKFFRPNLALINAQLQLRKWAHGDLGRHSHCSITTIEQILAGGEAYLQTLEKIASAIKVSVNEVILGSTEDSTEPVNDNPIYNKRSIKVSITVEGEFDSVSDPQLKALLKCFANELGSGVAPLALHGTSSGSIVIDTCLTLEEATSAVVLFDSGRLDSIHVVCMCFTAERRAVVTLHHRFQLAVAASGGSAGIIVRWHFPMLSPSTWLQSAKRREVPRFGQRLLTFLSNARDCVMAVIESTGDFFQDSTVPAGGCCFGRFFASCG